MSGALAQHRPGSKPLFDDHGLPVYKVPKEDPGHYPFDLSAIQRTLYPGGTWKDGRCQDYRLMIELRQRHVLDYLTEGHRPSKHARGRMRPRTAAERTRFAGLMRRAVQARKSMTVDLNRLAAMNLLDPA